MRAGSWCSRGQTLYDTHTFTPLMKLAPSWTLYYWISSYVVWESQRRTIQTSCSYWLQFDSLFTRLLLRFSSSLPQGQNWLYCSADCCLLLFTDGDGAGKIQLQLRGTEPNESTERILCSHFNETYYFSSVSHPARFQRCDWQVNFTCISRAVPLVDLFNFDLHVWFLDSVDIHTELC